MLSIAEAVRLLRGKESRQSFATRLGLSMSAVQNYEGGRMPEIPPLVALAREAHRQGEVHVFLSLQEELARQIGTAVFFDATSDTFRILAYQFSESKPNPLVFLWSIIEIAFSKPGFEKTRSHIMGAMFPVVSHLARTLETPNLLDDYEAICAEQGLDVHKLVTIEKRMIQKAGNVTPDQAETQMQERDSESQVEGYRYERDDNTPPDEER